MAAKYRFVEKGDTINIELTGDEDAGTPLLVGDKLVVTNETGKTGDIVSAAAVGVFELPCTSTAIAQGDRLEWSGSSLKAYAAGEDYHAVAWEDSPSTATTVIAKLV